MAITDILERIATDATAEAAEIVGAAEAEAARLVAAAEATVAAERTTILARAEYDAAQEAATLLANARLTARDTLLTGKRAMAERVVERAREAIEALPDDEYLAVIAAGVLRSATGGEHLFVAPADAGRLSGLAARLAELGADVITAEEPAPIARGVLLTGDRVRVEVSAAALVADRGDELLSVAARELFGTRGEQA